MIRPAGRGPDLPEYIEHVKELLKDVKRKMTAEEIDEAKRLSQEWFEKHSGRVKR